MIGSVRKRPSAGSSSSGASYSGASLPEADPLFPTDFFSLPFRETLFLRTWIHCLSLTHNDEVTSAGENPIAITADITTNVKFITLAPNFSQQPFNIEAITS